MSNYDQGRGGVQDAPMSRDPEGATAAYAPSPPQQMPQYGYQQQQYQQQRPRRSHPIETKPFFLTSEFVGAVLVIAGIAITAASSDAFGAWRAWILITAVTGAYMISRGIAKAGTRSHADDPRENLDLNWGQGNEQHSQNGR